LISVMCLHFSYDDILGYAILSRTSSNVSRRVLMPSILVG